IWNDADGDGIELLVKGYQEYDNLCRKAGVMDFDSLMLEMVDLLRTRDDILQKWQYKYIQVDESQDADAQQWALVQLLSKQSRNVFAVGDVGQCVYQWRSAMPELFLNFH